jgi:Tfp pilus assembly protein PilO
VQVKSKNMLVGMIVVLLVGALWYRVVYSPMESKASKAKSAAHDADASAANVRKQLDGVDGSHKKSPDPSTQVMLAAIPADTAQATFLRDLDALRVATGASWQSITPATPVNDGTITTISVGITVLGTQEQLAAYQDGLAAMKRLFVLDNVSMTATGGAGPAGGTLRPTGGEAFLAGQMSMQITGRIFSGPGTGSTAGSTAGSTTPASPRSVPTGGAPS